MTSHLSKFSFQRRQSQFYLKSVCGNGVTYLAKVAARLICPEATLDADIRRSLINLFHYLGQYSFSTFLKKLPDAAHNYGRHYLGYDKSLNLAAYLPGVAFLISGSHCLINLPVTSFSTPSIYSIGCLSVALLVDFAAFSHTLDLIYPSLSWKGRIVFVYSLLLGRLHTHWILKDRTWTNLLNVSCGLIPLVTSLLAMQSIASPLMCETLGTALAGLLQM